MMELSASEIAVFTLEHPHAVDKMSAILNTYRYLSLLLAGVFLLLLGAPPALAQGGEAELRAMLQARDVALKAAIKPVLANPKAATPAQREKVSDLINDPINFEEMGRQALGRYWKDLTKAQRADFVAVFGDIVRAQSLADLDIYNSSVAYETVKVIEDSAYVRTLTTYKDKKTPVEYYFGWDGKAWRVHDIVLDGVGTVEGYARSFQAVIRKRGFETLMKSLNKKRDKVAAKS